MDEFTEHDIEPLKQSFESISRVTPKGTKVWLARELMPLLDYKQWRNFDAVINKAMTAAQKVGLPVENHFAAVGKKVSLGYNVIREIDDVVLTRHACYLVAMNGNSRKLPIAAAQNYFAIKAREQEINEERIYNLERLSARKKLSFTEKEFASTLRRHDVDNAGIAAIRSRGDQVLFANNNTDAMKIKLGVPAERPLADFLPTVTIKAKDLAAEITTFNTRKKKLRGRFDISIEHKQNNAQIRSSLVMRGIKPEYLAAETDIKKLERKMKADDRALLKSGKRPSKADRAGGFDNSRDKTNGGV